MIVELGTKGLENSWQAPFESEVKCKCGGTARIAVVIQEHGEGDAGDEYVSGLHQNKPDGGWWPHDAIAVALYFCKECFEPVVVWNQA